MTNNKICLIHSEINSVRVVLDELKEEAISRGDIDVAKSIDDAMKELEVTPLCG